MLTKPEVKLLVKKETPKPQPPHHSGKGTRARLNTAAQKMFNQRASK